VIFGSRAKGRSRRGSDLDLAFLGSNPRRPPDRFRLWGDLTSLFGTEAIDLLDLRAADPLAAYEAFRGGKLLYEKEYGLFAARYSYAARLFADTRKFRDAEETYLDAFLARSRRRGRGAPGR
jgi:predicted nucleotidyltransferase